MNFSLRLALPLVLAGSLALVGCGEATSTEDPAVEQVGGTNARHTATIQRRIAANNAKDWSTWESLHTPGAVRTAPELPQPLVGAKAMRAGIEELVVTFPDYHLELVQAFGDGDRLVARIHTKGTMLGPMDIGGANKIPPTGKVFEQDWVAVITFDGDLIASIDEFHDNYGILIQLGLTQ